MIQSRRAIPSSPTPLYSIAFILFLCLFLTLGWLWLQAKKNIDENGPSLISQRMADVFNTSVSLSKASLSFPNHLHLEEILVYDTDKKTPILQSPRLEIDLSLLSMLTGTIRPKKVLFIAPKISSLTSKKTYFSGMFPKIIPRMKDKDSEESASWIDRLKPVSWPINIDPNHIEIIEAQAHIENEKDMLPSIDGRFDLTIRRSSDPDTFALKSADIHLTEVHIFYHGIQGVATGDITIDASSASVNLSLALPDNDALRIESKIYDYQEQAKVSFELNTNSYDLKNLAMIKYPLVKLSPSTSITGLVTSSSPVLYGTPFQSFTASVIFNQGNWRVDAISLKLVDDRGEISGSIIPDSAIESDLVLANLSYEGTSLPDLNLNADLLGTLGPILLQGPYLANTDIAIKTSFYPLQATEIKMTSKHGDLFLNGIIDLFSGYTDMTGSFLKPASGNAETKDNKGVEAISLGVSGPINAPNLSKPLNAAE